ncbi:hypothetical protein RYX36_009976, partial [Vicia faba]
RLKETKVDRLLIFWWAFTGLTHLVLESFFKDNTGFYLAEVWKEYSKGDSRHAGRDAAVVTVEGLTAVLEGPTSLLAVYAITSGKSYSNILQFAISLGQPYGTAVYYITAILEGGRLKETKVDRLLIFWWAFTGLTHLVLESFFKDNTGFYLAEVWKEYSKGDSRHAGRDAAVVTVEGLTAVLEGPTSLLAVYAITSGKSYSNILQFAISLGQPYGTAVYYITAILEGGKFSTNSFYYYSYYIGANFSWIVIPSIITLRRKFPPASS